MADPEIALATKGAISQARDRLGGRPVVGLFRRGRRPLATAQTPGASLFGLRLMAMDGVTEGVSDSPANARAPSGGSAATTDTARPTGHHRSRSNPASVP